MMNFEENPEITRIGEILDNVLMKDFQDGQEKDVMLYSNALVHKAYEFLTGPILAGIDSDDVSDEIKSHLSQVLDTSQEHANKINKAIKNLTDDGSINLPSVIMALLVNAMYLSHLAEIETSSITQDDIFNFINGITSGNNSSTSQPQNELDSFMKLMKEFENDGK